MRVRIVTTVSCFVAACGLGLSTVSAAAQPPVQGAPQADWRHSTESAIPGVDNFLGILEVSGCSGALVKFPSSQGGDKAMAMTNAHCTSAPREPGTFVADRADNKTWRIMSSDGKSFTGSLKADRIIYASQSGTDVALFQLTETFEQIKQKHKIDPLVLANRGPASGDAVTISSGGWKKMFKCTILNSDIYRMKENPSVWSHSVSYTTSAACKPGHGTSGSPIQDNKTGEIVAILNTGNDSGGKCSWNNPCEIDKDGKVTVRQDVAYGQQTQWLLTCVSEQRTIDLKRSGCMLTGGANAVDVSLPPGVPAP